MEEDGRQEGAVGLVRVVGGAAESRLVQKISEVQAGRLNERLETLENEIRERVSPRDVKGFQAVMQAVEEITRVRLREE